MGYEDLSDSGSELRRSSIERFIVGWTSSGLMSQSGRNTNARSWSRRWGIWEQVEEGISYVGYSSLTLCQESIHSVSCIVSFLLTCRSSVDTDSVPYMMMSKSIRRGPFLYDFFLPISVSARRSGLQWFPSTISSQERARPWARQPKNLARLVQQKCSYDVPMACNALSSSSGFSDVRRWQAAFRNFSWSVTYIGGVWYRNEVLFTSPSSRSCITASLNASTRSPTLLPIAM